MSQAAITAVQRDLERRAAALLVHVHRQVAAHPSRRGQIIARNLWGGPGEGQAGWAARTAARFVDRFRTADTHVPTPGVTVASAAAMVDHVLGPPATDLPAPTLADRDHLAFQRRLQNLRNRGAELHQIDGRWYRRPLGRGTNLVPVETARQLVQQRLARAETEARKQTLQLAAHLGITKPRNRRGQWTDPRLEKNWSERVAIQAARIAHDEMIDTFRDAAFDRMQQRGTVGWTRQCEPTACGACLALTDGSIHPASDRTFYRHTRCRCFPVPVNDPAKVPQTGQQIFDALTEAEQDALFRYRGGRDKAQALRAGHIQLADLLQVDKQRIAVTDYVIGETPLHALSLPTSS